MSLKNKFNKKPAELPVAKNTSNVEVVGQMINKSKNTDNNKTVNTEVQKKERIVKKATFELEEKLHRELKIQATKEGRKMVDVVEEALKDYLYVKAHM